MHHPDELPIVFFLLFVRMLARTMVPTRCFEWRITPQAHPLLPRRTAFRRAAFNFSFLFSSILFHSKLPSFDQLSSKLALRHMKHVMSINQTNNHAIFIEWYNIWDINTPKNMYFLPIIITLHSSSCSSSSNLIIQHNGKIYFQNILKYHTW